VGKIRNEIEQHRHLAFRAFEAVELEIVGEAFRVVYVFLDLDTVFGDLLFRRFPRQYGPYLCNDFVRFGDGLDDIVRCAEVERLLDLVRLAFCGKDNDRDVLVLLVCLTTCRTL
jgi:hypothetical protein